MSHKKVAKQDVLYMHVPDCKYRCDECSLFIPSKDRCVIHGLTDVIRGWGSCGQFTPGKPAGPDTQPRGEVTKIQTGYVEYGQYTCRYCDEFLDILRDCKKVDKHSFGDDPGLIMPGACCNGHEPLPDK